MRILVIPSNRPDSLREFLQAWESRGGWDRAIVVEDGPTRTFDLSAHTSCPLHHFSHAEIADVLGPDAWIISKRDSAIRCFGFLIAYWLGASHVLTLDDDVRPHYDDSLRYSLFRRHLWALNNRARWSSTVPGLRVRGLPYENPGRRDDVALSVGLWSGVPDLDGKTQLERGIPRFFVPPPGSRLLARGEYAPLCGMNLCVARCALPLMYFPLMGEGSPYQRFDDIWAGIIAKKVCDHLGWQVSVGEPFVRHVRASDPVVNARKEVPGIEANEFFWEKVDKVRLHSTTSLETVRHMGGNLAFDSDPYVRRLGAALQLWASLFSESAAPRFASFASALPSTA